jgi:ubiquinone/menaquinone biosynthesis C-methylase UbiE
MTDVRSMPAPPTHRSEAYPSEAYRSEAGRYDRRTDAFRHWRELLIQQLPLRRGDTVLDVGCGTGLCLPLLQHKIGPTGSIIGIDASEQMLQVAADRVAAHGWNNVRLIAAPVATAPIQATADAAVFCAVHDLMQCPAALCNVLDHLRPDAPVVAAGGKRPGPWMWPLQAWVTQLHAPFITDFTDFDQPWRQLARHIPDLQVRELTFGVGYVALGHAHSSGPRTDAPAGQRPTSCGADRDSALPRHRAPGRYPEGPP